MQVNGSREIDSLLRAYLRETDEAESGRLLEQLFCKYALPLIRQVIRLNLRAYHSRSDYRREAQDSEDINNEVVLQLLRRLSDFKSNPGEADLSDFRSYVAVAAYNACFTYFRQKHPERYRLKNKLRYILTHQKELALWEGGAGELLCGFTAWQGQKKPPCPAQRLQQLYNVRQIQELAAMLHNNTKCDSPAALLAYILNWAGDPVRLEDLVDLVLSPSAIRDQMPQTDFETRHAAAPGENYPDLAASLAAKEEQLIYLRQLWAEICHLPVELRAALLLGLRDGQGNDIVTLFANSRVATLREVAATLSMRAEELAELWKDLPLSDAAIAARLGLTPRQVINLRQSARRRLARRMKHFG
jgi:RNA polymerase sigma factor (sigma-70 family)